MIKYMEMNIAIASSLEYAIYYKTLLISLFENNSNYIFKVYYVYLDDELEPFINELNEYAITFGNKVIAVRIPDKYISNRVNVVNWSHITYARHALYEMLPSEVERILAITANTLVKDDISKLYNIDLLENTIAGSGFVKYRGGDSNKKLLERTEAKMHKMDVEIDLENWIVPSVLIVDVKKWKAKFSYKKYMNLIEYYGFQCLDEEALNIIFEGDKLPIYDGIYCTAIEVPEECVNKSIADSAIIHYPGDTKPWLTFGMTHISDMWWKYAKHSGLYEEYIKTTMQSMWKKCEMSRYYPFSKYQILDKFLTLKEKEEDFFVKQLVKRKIKNIILYGNGTMAKHIIYELKKTDIKIMCIVDAYNTSENSLFVHTFMDQIDKYRDSDGILVTIAFNIDDIKEYFKTRTNIPVIGIDELFI